MFHELSIKIIEQQLLLLRSVTEIIEQPSVVVEDVLPNRKLSVTQCYQWNFFNPSNSIAVNTINCGVSIKTLRQTLVGSWLRRHNHSSPKLRNNRGARRKIPLWYLNAAPTPTATGTFRRSRCSNIQRSCLGVPRPTHKISGLASAIMRMTARSSSSVRSRNGGEYWPTNRRPGKRTQMDDVSLLPPTPQPIN